MLARLSSPRVQEVWNTEVMEVMEVMEDMEDMEIRVTSVFAQVGESPLFTATGVAVRRAGARRRCGRDSFTAADATPSLGERAEAAERRVRVTGVAPDAATPPAYPLVQPTADS